ncbi:hypothetical protein H2248_009201 [Termitomyces sp. 'cryptogamus']|nr:hypothetical protein H2248_009201 [Termitomyces sp. 'cryptogamus']
MKRLFTKVQASQTASAGIGSYAVGVESKDTDVVPPIPNPCPYEYLEVVGTREGLVVRQCGGAGGESESAGSGAGAGSGVRIGWGKPVRIEEVERGGGGDWCGDWGGVVVVVYGIVGVLELFSCSYLVVVSSRVEVGNVIDESHTVYNVKDVTAIPLVEDQARMTLNSMASRNSQIARSSVVASTTLDTVSSCPQDSDTEGPLERPRSPESDDSEMEIQPRSAPRVKFSNDTTLKTRSNKCSSSSSSFGQELQLSSARSSSSDLSSSGQGGAHSPVANTLADRLSFWSRLSKRTSVGNSSVMEDGESLDRIIEDGKTEPAVVLDDILAATAPPPSSSEEKHSELETKIVRECIKEFAKREMYFAYNFDITRSLQRKQDQIVKERKQKELLADLDALPSADRESFQPGVEGLKVNAMSEPNPTLPLWRRVDRRFWWNEWLSKPFVDAGLHSYVLPIMQGYYQVARFVIPPDPVTHDEDVLVDYVIISRRSRYRAGLRYQRRGIDDDANVANFVETETIMRVNRLGVENIFAYVQLRGSIPLFWTQTGYGLKPSPLLATDRTHAQNLNVLRRHFDKSVALYGPHTLLNLAEQHGKEGAVTDAYRHYMQELDSPDARYHEYDFHEETKGMKYENISKLVESMDKVFDTQGYLWISDNIIMSQQKGVWRVNCIDCLDRTNVVQSAFARHVLNKQLGAVALLNPQSETRTETDIVFNDVWANNGDSISRAYAGTSALKGDFTRTGRRDLSGMLNDGVNSLARMYTATFSDWFSQAVIDFILGYRRLSVFSEFLLKLQSTDPRDLIRLSKIRAEAIATSVSRVLPEGERLLSGWTLFAPRELNKRIGDKFEEKVLLLTAKALYIVSYDYTLEKVKIYTRVPLEDILSISQGVYILSPLEEASRDPAQNAGFVITWRNTNQITRVTSYSIRNSLEVPGSSPTPPLAGLPAARRSVINAGSKLSQGLSRTKVPVLSNMLSNATLSPGSHTTFGSFKVLPIDPARTRRESSFGSSVDYIDAADELSSASNCQEAAEMIVDNIRRACEDIGGAQGEFVKKEDVVSLAEAQRMTSVYAKMEYGVKRLLWLGG